MKSFKKLLIRELLRPIGFENAVSTNNDSPRLPAPLARYRPRYPFSGYVPAEPESVLPGSFNVHSAPFDAKNHWTQESMPEKLPRAGFIMGKVIQITPSSKLVGEPH